MPLPAVAQCHSLSLTLSGLSYSHFVPEPIGQVIVIFPFQGNCMHQSLSGLTLPSSLLFQCSLIVLLSQWLVGELRPTFQLRDLTTSGQGIHSPIPYSCVPDLLPTLPSLILRMTAATFSSQLLDFLQAPPVPVQLSIISN